MGFVRGAGESIGGFVGGLTGATQAAEGATRAAETQAAAGREAIEAQIASAGRAQEFFQPFEGVSERGVEASQFLADPQAQFDFLQNNPLFNLALENANQRTLQSASAGRRLSFGDTLQQLSNNVLLSAQPLIDRQRQDVTNLLNFGTNVAGSRANIEQGLGTNVSNLTTDIGASVAAGQVGAANAQAQGFQNALTAGLTAAQFSDQRLKTNKRLIEKRGDFNWWSWDWNKMAGELFGLFGSSEGVMAHEVIKLRPDAVVKVDGMYKVNYEALGYGT